MLNWMPRCGRVSLRGYRKSGRSSASSTRRAERYEGQTVARHERCQRADMAGPGRRGPKVALTSLVQYVEIIVKACSVQGFHHDSNSTTNPYS